MRQQRKETVHMNNVERVQQLYAAFGRGDIPAILAMLSDNVEWEYGVNSTDVPWLQPRRGRADVGKFFEALAAVEITKFVPKHFLGDGDLVVALIDVDARVKATGRQALEEDEVHLWFFDGQGRVRRFRHRADTHQHWQAFHG
jgi:ketosteroid isomerase-like protein